MTLFPVELTLINMFCGEDLGKLYFHTAHLYYHECVDCIRANLLDEAVETAEKCLSDIHRYDRLPREYTFTTGIPEGYTLSITDELMEAADMTETEYILGLFQQSWAAPLREREDFRKLLEHYGNIR